MRKSSLAFFFVSFFTVLQGQNINLSNGFLFDGEPYLMVNPDNERELAVGWMGLQIGQKIVIKSRMSADGGQSWGPVSRTTHIQSDYSSADPSLAFRDNKLHLAFVDYTGPNNPNLDGKIVLSVFDRTSGQWSAPVDVLDATFGSEQRVIDRPWMVIDQSGGPHDGTIYVTSMNERNAPPPFHPYLSISTDGGQSFHTRHLDTTGWLSGPYIPSAMPTPDIGPDGIFYAAYPSYLPSQDPLPRFILARSEDGGQTFEYQSILRSTTTSKDTLAKKAYLLRCDPSDPEHLAFFFFSNTDGDADVSMVESRDGGQNWSDRMRINDDPIGNGVMQDLVWGDFNKEGDLVVSWRDRRKGKGSGYQSEYEFMAAYRSRDSIRFGPNFTLSDTLIPFDEILLGSGNDFMGVQLVGDTIHAVWGDTRDGSLNIWYQKTGINGQVLSVQKLASEKLPSFLLYPVPAADQLIVQGRELEWVRISGQSGNILLNTVLSKTSNVVRLDVGPLSPGYYFCTVKSKGGTATQKFILAK